VQFTRLRLSGFKSFVDPTELVIADGLTGVVGPNGCGKSNLLEAIRWVMGESRPSSMRGDGMEDVIFAGAASRPARNHAEVVLGLDNRDRRAPAGFNEADHIEVVRRITRDAGSAYRVNGREARARDVAMLFADASTGSQSPALVRQGQIAELINARPRARRRILEEAAGIAGLYQRRHEAELKLRATEANLGRVADVLEALEGQLAALARQAKQAARYREIAEALRRAEALLLWRLWRDAEDERAATAATRLAATREAGAAEARVADAARIRAAAETQVPAAREEDTVAAAILQRATLERSALDAAAAEAERRIAALEAAAGQLEADRAREAALDRDAEETAARLETERAALEAAAAGHDPALAAAEAEAARARATLDMVEAGHDARAEATARLAADHAAATRALAEAERRQAEAARALVAVETGLAAAEAELESALAASASASETAEARGTAAEAAEQALAEAETAAQQAREAERLARATAASADGAARALGSELAGLDRLLARPEGGVSPILDAVRVEPGYEAALGAALADDLTRPTADAAAATGWIALPPLDGVAALPEGAEPLAARVSAPEALARRLASIGIVEAAEGARLQVMLEPSQRLVSREGGLWRWDGLRLAPGAAPNAAAERLRLQNRRAALASDADAADRKAAAARAEAETAEELLAVAVAREAEARAARRAAEAALAEAGRIRTRAEAAAEAARARAAGLRSGRARRAEEAKAAAAGLEEARAAARGLADPAAARAALEAERVKVEAARLTMLTRRAEAAELARTGEARAARLAAIAREIADWQGRRASAEARLAGLATRAAETAEALDAARAEPPALAERRARLGEALDAAEARRRAASDRLARAETTLREADAALRAAEVAAGAAREARARSEALAEAAEARATAAAERLRAEAETELETLLGRFGADPDAVPGAGALEAEVGRLRRAREALGAVNLRAEEDARLVAQEHATLAADRDDLEEAVRKLRQGINALNREGRGRLLAAFETVNANFATLFTRLFGGGEATLTLVESDDPLEAGLEIMCQPPGKKLTTLSLLSGGEQTLTALSLIFAVFLANPSPICVLDEVDAPLDDANVGRFCDLLDEMTERTDTRFLIITHHAVTMARMDRLFGVTMAEQGVSQLVSVDLAAAERIVEPVA
jgi:chromosome segregation protein